MSDASDSAEDSSDHSSTDSVGEDAPGDRAGSATRVVLSYPASLSERARWRVERPYYRTYLRRTRDAARPGEEWAEFTDVGCCGSQQPLALRVESVDGGRAIGPETAIEFVEREGEVAGGWAVQNELTGLDAESRRTGAER